MRFLLLVSILICFACENAAPPEARADKLAKSLCNCTNALFELNKQAQSGSDSLAFRKIEQEFVKAKNCTVALGIKPEEKAAMEVALQTLCPTLATQKDLLQELLTQ